MRDVSASGGGISGALSMQAADSASIDAFSRWRVSNPATLFDSKLIYDLNPAWWQDHSAVNGSVSHSNPRASATMTTGGTASGNRVYRQTRRYFQYQPGKSQVVLITAVIGGSEANNRKRWGLFDAENGIYFEYQGSVLSIVRRTDVTGTPTNNPVAQSAWNLDKMDGTGASGLTLDLTKSNIFVIDFQWLGVGRVRVGVDIDGALYYVHEFRNANNLAAVYMSTPDLPIRYEIENTGLCTGTNTMEMICAAVLSEGGQEDVTSYDFAAGRTATVAVTTRRAVLSIRPTLLYNSIVNRMHMEIQQYALFVDTSPVYYEMVYNPTFTGTPTWAAANASSGMEFSLHGDAAVGAITGGTTIAWGYVAASNQTETNLKNAVAANSPLVLDAAGANPRAMSIVCTRLSGASAADVAASMEWDEHR